MFETPSTPQNILDLEKTIQDKSATDQERKTAEELLAERKKNKARQQQLKASRKNRAQMIKPVFIDDLSQEIARDTSLTAEEKEQFLSSLKTKKTKH